MQLELRPDEAALLKTVLEHFLSDLRMEIADTERYELRQSLKGDEEAIKAIIERLQPPLSS